MKRLISIFILSTMILTACGKEEVQMEYAQIPQKSSEQILKDVSGNYFSSDALEKLKDTRSAVDSFEGLYVLRIEKRGEDYQVMVGDGHQGVSLGNIKTAEVASDEVYTLKTYKDDNNYFNASYYSDNNMLVCNFKTDFAVDDSEQYEKYVRFDSDEKIAEAISLMLFEGAHGAEIKDGNVFAEIEGKQYKLLLSYGTVEVKTMHPSYMGTVTLMCVENAERITGAYKYTDGKITIVDDKEDIIAEFEIKE